MQKIFWGLIGFAITVLMIGTLRGEQSFANYLKLKKSRDLLKAKVEKLERDTKNYKLEITKIKKSKIYAKKILRDRYHVLEEDESIIFFDD